MQNVSLILAHRLIIFLTNIVLSFTFGYELPKNRAWIVNHIVLHQVDELLELNMILSIGGSSIKGLKLLTGANVSHF